MPAEYPFKPPAFVMLSPSGRFETGVKICLSISSFHPESWQPSWSVRSALIALIAFMQTEAKGAVGSLEHPPEVRREIAAEARATPPKHPNPDRQALINEMHQKMLDMEETSKALHAGPPRESDTVPESPASTGPEAQVAETQPAVEGDQQQRQEQPAASPASPASQQQQGADTPPGTELLATPSTVDDEASVPLLATTQQQGQTAQQQPTPSRATTPPPAAAVASPALSPQSPAQHHQQLQPAAQRELQFTPNPQTPPRGNAPATMATPQSVQYQATPLHHHHLGSSWEDKGLTYLAVLLIVCITTLLLRRVLVSVRIEPDELFSVNPVADVEL